jgi:hypothetical protein
MLSYDEIVIKLEEAWVEAGFHEYLLTESVEPETHTRTFKVELFSNLIEIPDEEVMLPWLEISFTWSPVHQLLSDGYKIKSNDPVNLTWAYNVIAQGDLSERGDRELARLYRNAVERALRTMFSSNAIVEPVQLPVEVRRTYQCLPDSSEQVFVQLVSSTLTNLSEMWTNHDSDALQALISNDTHVAGAIIQSLAKTFLPSRPLERHQSSYRPVDAA